MTGPVVRVATYNVLHLLRGGSRVAGVLRELRADVVCVQEAPRIRWRARCAALAREAGLVYVVGGGDTAGAMLLASPRMMTVHAERYRLPWTSRYRRGVAAAVFAVGGRRLAAASVHLSLHDAERQRHLDVALPRLTELARRHDAPYVVAGDVNERPGAPAWRRLADGRTDAYAAAPQGAGPSHGRLRIDAVFAGPGIEVLGCGVPDLPGLDAASDHRPVVAELRLEG